MDTSAPSHYHTDGILIVPPEVDRPSSRSVPYLSVRTTVKIRFDVTMDDLIAFNLYHQAHSPIMRRFIVLMSCLIPLSVLVPGGLLALWVGFEPEFVIPTVVVTCLSVPLICIFMIPRLRPLYLGGLVRRMYSEGANKGMLGSHELELREKELICRTSVGEAKVLLGAVEKIVSTDKHAFIYLSAVSGYVVPRDSVSEGDCDAFVEALTHMGARARD
jgi:hypothetical protein